MEALSQTLPGKHTDQRQAYLTHYNKEEYLLDKVLVVPQIT